MLATSASALDRIQAQLQSRLGPVLSVICTGVDGDTGGLWPEELPAVARAIPRRQREFAAGRAAAREAIRRVIGVDRGIPSNPDRSPCWPEGLVGSIAHTTDACVAVVGRQGQWQSLGVDIEPDCGIDESLWDIICTPEELHLIRQAPLSGQALLVARLFVAKEAFYKWHFPQWKTMLDFQDVCVQWSDDWCDFAVSLRRAIQPVGVAFRGGRVLFTEGYLIATCASKMNP